MNCWVCGSSNAVWKNQAHKEKTPDTPAVSVEYWACEKCVPFELARKGPQKETEHVG